MSDRDRGPEQEESIFRKEALEHYVNRGAAGDVMRMKTKWSTVGFWALIAAFVGALVASAFVTVDSKLEVPGVYLNDQRLLATWIPNANAEEVRRAHTVTFRSGAKTARLKVMNTPLSEEESRIAYHSLPLDVGIKTNQGVRAFLTRATPSGSLPGIWREKKQGIASITIREPLIVVLFPPLGRFL